MNQMFRKIVPVLAMALSVCTAPALFRTEELAAADLETTPAVSASDRLTYAENGNVYYIQGDQYVTGKFSLEPNFLLGDINGDHVVNSADAADLLEMAAEIGSGAAEMEEIFLIYGDVDEDGMVNSADAAEILEYAAESGASAVRHPLGFAYYYADENGVLQTGRIDTESGESYIAGEDYKLLTGWAYTDGHAYYLDTEGIMQKNTWMKTDSGKICWLGSDGALTVNSWVETEEGVYYLGEDGCRVDGLQEIYNKGYYFENHMLRTGWLTIGDKTCYAGEDGALYYGLREIGENTYYFGSSYEMLRGWVNETAGKYYFNEDGIMLTGWQEIDGQTYYMGANGICRTGLVNVENDVYYLDENGILQTGFLNIDGDVYYFYPENGHMATGFVYLDQDQVYYFGAEGKMASGWQTIGEELYYFGTEGLMTTGIVRIDGVLYAFDANGVCLGEYTGEVTDVAIMLNTAVLSEPKRSITVYDQQKGSGKSLVDFTIRLSDADIAIIEQFAAENFPANSTLAEKLYITHQWIHYNVDYAYAGEKWNEIVNLSYVDAVFNHRKGQCVQYNGAMASVLAYYGFDVYMVKGYTSPGTQHFWTEVELNGHTYMVECGNSGKNGDWWQYFFDLMD